MHMCADVCADLCKDMRISEPDTCATMCVDVFGHMRADMCADTGIDMCIGVCACVLNMSTDVGLQAHANTRTHARGAALHGIYIVSWSIYNTMVYI